MHRYRGRTGGPKPPPLENHKVMGFLSNIGPGPFENHKAIKPAFNVGPSSDLWRKALQIAVCSWANDGPFLWYLDPLSPHQLKKIVVRGGLSVIKFSGSAHRRTPSQNKNKMQNILIYTIGTTMSNELTTTESPIWNGQQWRPQDGWARAYIYLLSKSLP